MPFHFSNTRKWTKKFNSWLQIHETINSITQKKEKMVSRNPIKKNTAECKKSKLIFSRETSKCIFSREIQNIQEKEKNPPKVNKILDTFLIKYRITDMEIIFDIHNQVTTLEVRLFGFNICIMLICLAYNCLSRRSVLTMNGMTTSTMAMLTKRLAMNKYSHIRLS